jgi:REP element-mobilizing transposase RayT
MSRATRTEYPGATHHVTSRGHRKKPIFKDDRDRERFFEILEEVARRYKWIITVHTLMTNHFHLVIQTPQPNLGHGMRCLNAAYAAYFNKRNGRINALFGDRYTSILVESEEYLQRLARYVVLNPVRAGMVQRPEEYRWSSYRATAGLEAAPEWLTLAPLVPFFGEPETWRANYIAFVNDGCAAQDRIWNHLRRRFFLTTEKFLKELKKIMNGKLRSDIHPAVQRLAGSPSAHAIATEVGRQFQLTPRELRAMRGGAARMMTAWIAWYEGAHRLRKIAALLRLRSSGHVSNLVRQAEREISRDPELQRRLDFVYEALS